MKPSRYTFLVVPDHDGDSKRFSISRKGTLFLIYLAYKIASSTISDETKKENPVKFIETFQMLVLGFNLKLLMKV